MLLTWQATCCKVPLYLRNANLNARLALHLSIAHTHLHIPSAAADALAALSGVKSSLVMYFSRILAMIFGGMLSLS